MRKLSLVLLLIASLLIIAACGEKPGGEGQQSDANANNDGQVTVTHQLDTVTVKRNPSRVVIFDFGILDTLDYLDLPVIGVPQSNIPPYLAKYGGADYENVGSLREPDFEAIHALKPELIIISHRQLELYSEFKSIAPTVYVGLDYSDYMASFKHNVTMIGEIFDKQAEVAEAIADIDSKVQSLYDTAANSDKKALITLATGGKISAYGPQSRFGLIHDAFGIKAVDENIDVSTHGMSVSFEYVADANPDYLFVVDRDAVVEGSDQSAKDVIENALIKQTNAYQNGYIIYLDPNYWYLSGGGLISVAEMIKQVSEGIQP